MSPPSILSAAVDLVQRPAGDRVPGLVSDGRPKIVGILNVTPDSFYDGGRHHGLAEAVKQAEQMAAEGAAIIDVGGQSTRPGHTEVTAGEEMARVVPVIAALAARLRIPLSIDTDKPAVARAALDAGAALINDVRGFHGDPELAAIAARHGCGVILMHQEAMFQLSPEGAMERVGAFLGAALERALVAGVPRGRVILDPGIGFAKTHAQNLEILSRLGELRRLGCPLLLGASRKSVIGRVLDLPPDDRLEGTLATTALAVWHGVEYLRVHDVRANLRAALMAQAVRDAAPLPS
jgi:dihydropteroate synthase